MNYHRSFWFNYIAQFKRESSDTDKCKMEKLQLNHMTQWTVFSCRYDSVCRVWTRFPCRAARSEISRRNVVSWRSKNESRISVFSKQPEGPHAWLDVTARWGGGYTSFCLLTPSLRLRKSPCLVYGAVCLVWSGRLDFSRMHPAPVQFGSSVSDAGPELNRRRISVRRGLHLRIAETRGRVLASGWSALWAKNYLPTAHHASSALTTVSTHLSSGKTNERLVLELKRMHII